MKLKILNYLLIIHFIIFLTPSLSQIIIDPVSIEFNNINNNEFLGKDSVIVRINSSIDWSISCIAELLINESTGSHLSPNQLLMKNNLTETYQAMNTSFDIGNGGPTMGDEIVVNILYFKIITTGDEPYGLYSGIIRFFSGSNEVIQLSLSLFIKEHLVFNVSPRSSEFITSTPDLYTGNTVVNVSIEDSNTDKWHVEASIPASSPTDNYFKNNIYIKSSNSNFSGDEGAGAGYQVLNNHPVLLSGNQLNYNNGSSLLEFKLNTDWTFNAGNYNSIIELQIPELKVSHYIDINVLVEEYNILSLSESGVYFHVNGPPDVWDGDRSVKLTVGSNSNNWSVICDATNLKSSNDLIPNSRIFMKINPDDFTGDYGAGIGYYKLSIPQLEVASGSQIPPTEMCELLFRLKTLDEDRPGHYEGIITFTQLTNP